MAAEGMNSPSKQLLLQNVPIECCYHNHSILNKICLMSYVLCLILLYNLGKTECA